MLRRLALAAVAALAATATVAVPDDAAAHGMMPDTMDVFLRASAPSEVVLATNFGLLISEDAGVSWSWVCEDAFGSYAVNRYNLGPNGALYVASFDGLFVSTSGACGFKAAGGDIAQSNALDVAPDPSDAQHVTAIAVPLDDGGVSDRGFAFESSDGGTTFKRLPAFPGGMQPLALRLSPDGKTLYVAGFVSVSGAPSPRLAVRGAGASTFTVVDLSALDPDQITAMLVDPADGTHVFFMTSGPRFDHLYESRTSGAMPVQRLMVEDRLRGLAFGDTAQTVLLGAQNSQTLYQSDDGGMSFSMMGGGPHFRCLAARGNSLWGCGDWSYPPFGDGYALGRSSGKGGTWNSALRLQDLGMAAASCLGTKCSPSYNWLCGYVCSGDDGGIGPPEPRESTKMEKTDAALPDAPAGGGDAPGAQGGGGGGCGCRFGGAPAPWSGVFALAAFLLRRRARRGGQR